MFCSYIMSSFYNFDSPYDQPMDQEDHKQDHPKKSFLHGRQGADCQHDDDLKWE